MGISNFGSFETPANLGRCMSNANARPGLSPALSVRVGPTCDIRSDMSQPPEITTKTREARIAELYSGAVEPYGTMALWNICRP